MDTAELLQERGKTHGDFTVHARVTQDMKANFYHHVSGRRLALSCCQREAIDMIFHKLGRIVAGDPDFKDHWDDIAGYAKLVADRCPQPK